MHPTALATIRFDLPSDEVDGFVSQLRPALSAIAARPGYVRGYVGQAVDQPGLITLVLEFVDIGSYRRAISATDVKYAAHPLLYRALDEPNAYEVLHINEDGNATDLGSNIADWSRNRSGG